MAIANGLEGDGDMTGANAPGANQPGGGAATHVIRDGHGSDTIPGLGGGIGVIAFDMAEISSYTDILDRMSGSGDDTLITFDNADTLTILDIRPECLTSANFTLSAPPACLWQGTLIHTQRGEIPIEYLRPDDIVWTKDRGWQAIRLVTREAFTFDLRNDPAQPILIPAGALGGGLPATPLITSPQHRVLQIMPVTGEEILTPAVKLIGCNGIRRMRGKKRADYFNIVMERHSIIQAAGWWVESMLVSPRALSRQSAAARRMLNHCLGMAPARRIEREGARPRRLKSV